MTMVQRANVVLEVPDNEIEKYLNQGYNVLNPDGTVAQSAVPRDITTLQRAFVDNSNTIKALKAEIENLQTQLAAKSTESRKKKTTETTE